MIVVSPFAKPGYAGKKHYSTALIVKTEELLLGLPPNNLGDLFATDMRDMFQPTYNGITAGSIPSTWHRQSETCPSKVRESGRWSATSTSSGSRQPVPGCFDALGPASRQVA